ncbi:hypothetical protein EDD68_107112 [Melghiribacillus thermohalophilus]|uniref:Uncharacterized protein n=1 Tax=Melghiribacillus thermohalophilus TaxID=1324956 RepID=A0A4R3N2R4_9BACI|nr:hypothetical protein [Melghiribacillus thermohalophilus]TCT23398.1 hypothetical protein EDD68_107112 [Melghiribacillus thermohalophilus]
MGKNENQEFNQSGQIQADPNILLNVLRQKNIMLNNQNDVLNAKLIELQEENMQLKQKMEEIDQKAKNNQK